PAQARHQTGIDAAFALDLPYPRIAHRRVFRDRRTRDDGGQVTWATHLLTRRLQLLLLLLLQRLTALGYRWSTIVEGRRRSAPVAGITRFPSASLTRCMRWECSLSASRSSAASAARRRARLIL